MKIRFGVLATVILFAVSGCGFQAALTGGGSSILDTANQAENLVPELILQKYQALHNLKTGMEQIDANKGPVTMITPAARVVPQ